MRKRLLSTILLASAGLGAALLAPGCGSRAEAERFVVAARRAPFPVIVECRGLLKPLVEEEVKSQVPGMISSMSEQGDPVKKGDVVVQFDTQDIENTIRDRKADLAIAQAEFVKAQETLAKRRKSQELAIRRQEAQAQCLELSLNLLRAGASANDKIAAAARVQTSRIILDARREELEVLRGLTDGGYISRDEFDKKTVDTENARIDHERAKIAVDRLKEFPTADDVKANELDLELARGRLDDARRELAKITDEAIAQERVRVQKQEKALSVDEEQLAKMTMRAPVEGIVTERYHWGQPVAPGRQIWGGIPLMAIADLARMKVEVLVPEDSIRNVALGQACAVRLAALPLRPLVGKVIKIANIAKDEFADLDNQTRRLVGDASRKAFAVDVEIAGADPLLRPNLTARVQIVLKTLPSAVRIPLAALEHDAKGYFVWVVRGAAAVRTPVAPGERDRYWVVIDQGIAEGDRVAVPRNPAGALPTPVDAVEPPPPEPAPAAAPKRDRKRPDRGAPQGGGKAAP